MSGLSNVVAVYATTSAFSLALKADGTVLAWGRNYSGNLGDGTTIDRHIPVVVSGLSGVIAISGGGEYGLAPMPGS